MRLYGMTSCGSVCCSVEGYCFKKIKELFLSFKDGIFFDQLSDSQSLKKGFTA
jgi:hypothetical protein